MKLGFELGMVLAAVALGSPAAAQSADEAKSVRTMHKFGECVVSHNRFLAERVLRTVPGSDAEEAFARESSSDSCLTDGELRFKAKLLRGVIAEQLFENDFGTFGAPPKRRTAAVFAPLTSEQVGKMTDDARTRLALLDFSTCVVKADPQDVVDLFSSEPKTSGEAAAFGRLAPYFGPCANKGVAFTIVEPQLRGALAEAAYRLSVARSEGHEDAK